MSRRPNFYQLFAYIFSHVIYDFFSHEHMVSTQRAELVLTENYFIF